MAPGSARPLLVTGLIASMAVSAASAPEADRLLEAIEAAFRGCRTAPLQRVLPPKSRVHFGLEGIPAGWVGPDQLLLLLERFFSGKTTLRFVLQDPGPGGFGPTTTARWEFRERGGEPRGLTLEFRFVREGKQRILAGIRSLP